MAERRQASKRRTATGLGVQTRACHTGRDCDLLHPDRPPDAASARRRGSSVALQRVLPLRQVDRPQLPASASSACTCPPCPPRRPLRLHLGLLPRARSWPLPWPQSSPRLRFGTSISRDLFLSAAVSHRSRSPPLPPSLTVALQCSYFRRFLPPPPPLAKRFGAHALWSHVQLVPLFLPRPLFPTPAPANPIDANVCAISHSRSPPGLPHLQTPSIPSPSWEFPTMISQMSSSPTRCLHDCRCLSAVRFQSSRQNPGYSQQQRLSVCIIHRPPPRPYTKDPTDHLSGPHLLLASVLNMTSPFLTYHPPDNSPQTAPLSRPSPDCPRSNPDACLANPSPVSNTATCPPSSPWPSPSLLAHFTLW